jgi:TldD protein
MISADMNEILDQFGVNPTLLQRVVAGAMSRGGDYADLYFEHRRANSLSLEDGSVNRSSSRVDLGMGVRVLKGDQTGFAFTESLDPKDMLQAAATASRIAEGRGKFSPPDFNEKKPANHYPVSRRWEEVSVEERMPFLHRINELAFGFDPKVIKVNASLSDETSTILFYNSDGLLTWDYRPLAGVRLRTVMEKNGSVEYGTSARSFRIGYEWIGDGLAEEIARESIDRTNVLFGAIRPRAGEIPVVLGAGGSGILLHEAMGHAFEADFNRKRTSIFSDRMGKKVAGEFIHIV